MTTRNEILEQIALSRTVNADAVIERMVDLRAYPHHYLMIHSDFLAHGMGVRKILTAAELLRPYGWELLTVTEMYASQIYGILRRSLFAASPAPYTEPPVR